MKEQNLIYVISGQFQYVQNNNLAGSHTQHLQQVQVCKITPTEIQDHTHLLRASKEHKQFRILSIISVHPADTQPEKIFHSQKKKKNLCFSCNISSTLLRVPSHMTVSSKLVGTEVSVEKSLGGFIRFISTWSVPYITLSTLHLQKADKRLPTGLDSISPNSCLRRTSKCDLIQKQDVWVCNSLRKCHLNQAGHKIQ